MKTVAEMYYHRLEYVDNFDNLEDIFFKFGLNLSDELIPQVQKALPHKCKKHYMRPSAISWYRSIPATAASVPVHTGNGSIDLIIPGVHKANGLPTRCTKANGLRRQRSGGLLAMAVTILRCCVRQALVLQWKMPAARSSQRQNTGQAPITVKAYWM